ncbi:hypothetical protein F5884DRAFT_856159 [Xylogone sp. PMI_703]|nr:hypothetical protein F5884DRAFT_856159 [Xylogone sp. PMI_703]
MEFMIKNPSDIHFKRRLFGNGSGRASCCGSSSGPCAGHAVVYLVAISGKLHIMKIHRHFEQSPYSMPGREYNPYVCELKAYQRLKQSGICNRGIVPQYYGTINDIDWQLYQPHLDMFSSDPHAPNAVILEYIQDAKILNDDNYTIRRKENFLSGIKEIHNVLIEHSDIATRNMMVVDGDPERAVWIDFDRAQTFERLRQPYKGWIEFEFELVVEILEEMEATSKEVYSKKE